MFISNFRCVTWAKLVGLVLLASLLPGCASFTDDEPMPNTAELHQPPPTQLNDSYQEALSADIGAPVVVPGPSGAMLKGYFDGSYRSASGKVCARFRAEDGKAARYFLCKDARGIVNLVLIER